MASSGTASSLVTSPKAATSGDEALSFVSDLAVKEKSDLEFELQTFIVRHASQHRPVALVTSGGTAADLEVNSVRCLDNFSTGLRGAISVEEFLKRGYAVIHLRRRGSAAPYSRVLSQCLGLAQANHGLSVDSLGLLFAGDPDHAEDHEDEMVKAVLGEDPWLTEESAARATNQVEPVPTDSGLSLHRRLVHSSLLQRALRAQSSVLREGRLLTVPFRTVEEYLSKLQLCAEALRDSSSLAIIYLAAAVSDFYVPNSLKSVHKIQSDPGNEEPGLVLKLYPVPKVMGTLRQTWAPDAYVVSFKLETDKAMLRQKAERAVQRYGVHMVIGNLLKTRHERVWVLHPPPHGTAAPETEWPLQEIAKSESSGGVDALEDAIIGFVVERHFDYISSHWNGHTSHMSGTEAAIRTHERLKEKKVHIERELYWRRVRNVVVEVAGSVLGMGITWAITTILTKRIHLQQSSRP